MIPRVSHRPLLLPLCSFAGGIASAGFFGIYLPDYHLPIVILLALATLTIKSPYPFMFVLNLLLFVGGNLAPQAQLRGNPADKALLEQHFAEKMLVEGRVAGRPETRDNISRIQIRPDHLFSETGELRLFGDIMLRVEGGRPDLSSGDTIRFIGRLRAPRNYGTPGEFDAERYFALKGIVATSYARNMDGVVLIRRGEDSLQRRFDSVAARIANFITESVPASEGGILKALLVGDSSDIPQELRDAYGRTGVNHILSISGFHIGIIALALFQVWFAVSRIFPFLLLGFNLRRTAPLLSLPLVLSYMLISGAQPATARAVLMLVIVVAGLLLEREFDQINSLVLAAFVLLLFDPGNLFDISFQLSFLAIWGLIVITPLLLPLSGSRDVGVALWFARFFAASVAAVAVTLLPVACYFNQATLTGLISNFIIVPLLGYGAVVAGFASIPLIWLFPAGAGWMLAAAALPVRLSNWIIVRLDSLPLLPDIYVTRIDTALLLAGLLLLTLIAGRTARVRILVAVPLIIAAIHQFQPRETGVAGRIDFFSVGQGESMLLTFANGTRMLVDGGGALNGSGWDPGERLLLPALRDQGVKRIDYMVLSHPHPDHLLGLLAVARSLPIGEFWGTGVGGGEDYPLLVKILEQRGVKVRQLDSGTLPLVIPGARVTVLYPEKGAASSAGPADLNETSLVMRIDTGSFSVLLTGDIGIPAESRLLRKPEMLHADILKVPHHGSRYSVLPEFFRAVSPKVALIGAGYRNSFGLPSGEMLESLRASGVMVCRTDLDGTITVKKVNDSETLVISSFKRQIN